MSTKIHTTVDALGNPTAFHQTGEEAHDLVGADALLPDIAAAAGCRQGGGGPVQAQPRGAPTTGIGMERGT